MSKFFLNEKFSTSLEMAYWLFSKLISMEFSSSFPDFIFLKIMAIVFSLEHCLSLIHTDHLWLSDNQKVGVLCSIFCRQTVEYYYTVNRNKFQYSGNAFFIMRKTTECHSGFLHYLISWKSIKINPLVQFLFWDVLPLLQALLSRVPI